ncbi:S1 RNA-binding domain-containing protein [Gynuella sunshinyii]|uniref:S1 RNA-binding domain-containing protein n=1 Tax=Gynuella sunshinyii TaxID=1445505 RepID=UPI0005CC63A7|nr:S1 RNA-binding domain-containing protein [Gynuella sunshinyii]
MTNITWEELKKTLEVGALITGTITRHEPHGVFVDIGYGYDGLIQITDFKDEGVMTPEEYPVIGKQVQAKILGFKDHGCQVWLGVKPSQIH